MAPVARAFAAKLAAVHIALTKIASVTTPILAIVAAITASISPEIASITTAILAEIAAIVAAIPALGSVVVH